MFVYTSPTYRLYFETALDMLFLPTEMHVELVGVLKQLSKRSSIGHLNKGIYILGKTLAAIVLLTIGAGNICVLVVDIA